MDPSDRSRTRRCQLFTWPFWMCLNRKGTPAAGLPDGSTQCTTIVDVPTLASPASGCAEVLAASRPPRSPSGACACSRSGAFAKTSTGGDTGTGTAGSGLGLTSHRTPTRIKPDNRIQRMRCAEAMALLGAGLSAEAETRCSIAGGKRLCLFYTPRVYTAISPRYHTELGSQLSKVDNSASCFRDVHGWRCFPVTAISTCS
jgi:hypothetical protein